jgi:hypothetical protein
MQPEEERDDTALMKALDNPVVLRRRDLPCVFPRCQGLGLYLTPGGMLCIDHLNQTSR